MSYSDFLISANDSVRTLAGALHRITLCPSLTLLLGGGYEDLCQIMDPVPDTDSLCDWGISGLYVQASKYGPPPVWPLPLVFLVGVGLDIWALISCLVYKMRM